MSKILTFGEIMLRFSTENGFHISDAVNFHVHYGGAEANVAVNMAGFDHDAVFVSKVPDSALGYAVKKHLRKFGVDISHLRYGGNRLGTYYVDSGVGQRPSQVIYDRAFSSFASLETFEWDYDEILNDVDLVHISGITPALSEKLTEMTIALVKEAKNRGIKVSFDINYRSKLWDYTRARKAYAEILPYCDIVSAGKMDALYLLEIPENTTEQDDLAYYYEKMHEKYPNISVFYSTIREVFSASHNTLQGTLWIDGKTYYSKVFDINPIVDRVGGGDAFASGILHGLCINADPEYTVSFATAYSSLKHTFFGDNNPYTLKEVEQFIQSGSAKINR